jgi:Domain of unknown function (DUF3597)
MSIFSDILAKLGIKKPAVTAKPAATAKPGTAPSAPVQPTTFVPPTSAKPGMAPGAPVRPPSVAPTSMPFQAPSTPPAMPAMPTEMPMVDVVSKLDKLAKSHPDLNWKTSIMDLMKLLGLYKSPQDIKDLAVELGCPASEMSDSYKRNVWTHKELLRRIAANGGNIPQSLLK